MSTNIVITGGKGDIAQAIKKTLGAEGFNIQDPDSKELDVTSEAQIKKFFLNKKIDILINAAGYIRPALIVESETKDWIRHFNVNIIGSYLCIKNVLQVNPSALIINIASTSGLEGRAEWSAYSASKSALISLTQSLAKEGFSAYAISPARTNTHMRRQLFPQEGASDLLDPSEIASVVDKIVKKQSELQPGINIVVKKSGIETIKITL